MHMRIKELISYLLLTHIKNLHCAKTMEKYFASIPVAKTEALMLKEVTSDSCHSSLLFPTT